MIAKFVGEGEVLGGVPVVFAEDVASNSEAPHSGFGVARGDLRTVLPESQQHPSEEVSGVFGLTDAPPEVAEEVVRIVVNDDLDPVLKFR